MEPRLVVGVLAIPNLLRNYKPRKYPRRKYGFLIRIDIEHLSKLEMEKLYGKLGILHDEIPRYLESFREIMKTLNEKG